MDPAKINPFGNGSLYPVQKIADLKKEELLSKFEKLSQEALGPRVATRPTTLSWSITQIGGSMLTYVKSFFWTGTLSVAYRKIYDKDLEELLIANSGLTNLDISGCYLLTDKSIETIAKTCPGLVSLVAKDCANFSAGALTKLPNEAMEELDLFGCQVDDSVCQHIATMSKLRYLNIAQFGNTWYQDLPPNLYVKKGIIEFAQLTDLQVLNLSGLYTGRYKGTTQDLGSLANCQNLEDLNLNACEVGDDIGPILVKMSKLKRLDLSYNKDITEETLKDIGKTQINHLILAGVAPSTAQGIKYLPKTLQGFHWFCSLPVTKTNALGVMQAIGQFTELRSLQLSGLKELKLTPDLVNTYWSQLTKLEYLSLGLPDLNDEAIESITAKNRNIESLLLVDIGESGWAEFTAKGIEKIANQIQQLNNFLLMSGRFPSADQTAKAMKALVKNHKMVIFNPLSLTPMNNDVYHNIGKAGDTVRILRPSYNSSDLKAGETDAGFKNWDNLKNVTALDMGLVFGVSGKGWSFLPSLKQLRRLELWLSYGDDGKTTMETIAKCASLEELQVVFPNTIGNSALEPLCQLKHLRYLDFGGNSLDDGCEQYLLKMTSLQEINAGSSLSYAAKERVKKQLSLKWIK